MLPFLKRNHESGASAPVETQERKPDEGSDEFDGLETAMEELHNALMAKNYKGAAQLFRDAFDLLESEPHEETEHNTSSEPNFNR